jgi:glycine/D-amino acid oxidase-like deaminating enzyme
MRDMTAYGGSIYAAQIDAPARPQLTIEIDVDVCVIGAGLAGLTTARELARRGWSVAVLEARRVAWNASGRNTGFVLPGFAADEKAITERVGADHARALWQLSEQGADYVRASARELAVPSVDLVEGGWLNVWKTDDDASVSRLAEFYASRFGAPVEHWPKERVRETLRSNRYFSALNFPRGFSINPLAYAQGLAAAAEAAGARIFENTPALDIDPAGVRKRITTPQARVRAGRVVLAGNMHIKLLMPKFAATLVPCSTYAIVTEPLGPQLREAIRTDAAVSDTQYVDNHYRIIDGDRLLWCGRCTTWESDPQGFTKTLLRDIGRTFPQLKDVKAAYSWVGTLGNTVHLMPQIGELQPGVWLLSGFGGHGLNTTAMGGDLVARAIAEDDTTWKLFSPFELVWAGGRLGRAAVQAYYYGYRARESVNGFLSRRREAEKRRKDGLPPLEVPAPSLAPAEAAPAQPVTEDKPKKKRSRKKKTEAAAEGVSADKLPEG